MDTQAISDLVKHLHYFELILNDRDLKAMERLQQLELDYAQAGKDQRYNDLTAIRQEREQLFADLGMTLYFSMLAQLKDLAEAATEEAA